jgi:hypothetical protein
VRPGLALVLGAAVLLAACGGESRIEAEPLPQDDPLVRPLPVRGGLSSESRIEPLFAEAAKAITNNRFDYEVRCWSAADWPEVVASVADPDEVEGSELELVGFVYGQSLVNLAPEVCDALASLAYRSPRPRGQARVDDAQAVVVFAHEIGHAIVGASEPATECWAIQKAAVVARTLGAGPRYASTTGTVYLREVYPLLPPDYRSSECRNGGAFDENPESDVWP